MNIVANSIGHHVSQPTQKDSVKSEGDSLFASLFTKEISSTPKESLSEEDKLQKMIQRLREVLSSGNKKIEKDDMRVILPITLKDDLTSGIFAFSHTACVEQTTKEVTGDEPSMLVRDETMLPFLQTIEQMLSLGAHDEISDEALIHMTTTLEAFLQESENSLSEMNEADVMKHIQSLFSDVNVSTEELINLAGALENLLHRIDSETSENHNLSLFISQMVETLEITLHAHDLGENVTSLTNHSPINIDSVHEGNGGKNQGVFMDEFQRISKESQQLIEEILQNEQSSKANKQLLHLLEQAQSLKQTFNEIPTDELIEGSKDTKNIWMNLQSMYEKRSSLNKSGTYFHNAKVLSSDVGVWVERLTSENAASQAQPVMQVQQHMSPVEHFVLHTRTQDGQVVQQEQMMHQIQQIVQQSAIGKNQFF
ncbi:MAG TPA: hypothetical protein VK144_09890, partial [Bacillota bacterium]|nr:hypothetical protein [Bacillota bacterium]